MGSKYQHYFCVTRDASGAASPGCSRRRGDRQGPRVAAGTVTVTPRPLQLLIPSPSPVPEEGWAAAEDTTAHNSKACGRTSHPRRSNGRVHLDFPPYANINPSSKLPLQTQSLETLKAPLVIILSSESRTTVLSPCQARFIPGVWS